jgi:hypothetical protein
MNLTPSFCLHKRVPGAQPKFELILTINFINSKSTMGPRPSKKGNSNAEYSWEDRTDKISDTRWVNSMLNCPWLPPDCFPA